MIEAQGLNSREPRIQSRFDDLPYFMWHADICLLGI